jgi:hypothetical protein
LLRQNSHRLNRVVPGALQASIHPIAVFLVARTAVVHSGWARAAEPVALAAHFAALAASGSENSGDPRTKAAQ